MAISPPAARRARHSKERPVLVIEDDEGARSALVEAFTRAGFGVIDADEARKALELVETTRPSVVLLDLVMEGMNGWEFLERRLSVPSVAQVPVIVMTGTDAHGVQADAVIHKPLDLAEVVERVRELGKR